MKKNHVWRTVAISVMLIVGLICLSSCSRVSEMKLTHSNGAEVQIAIDTSGISASVKDNILYVTRDGVDVLAQLVDNTFVSERMSQSDYNTFDINGGTGISYETNGRYEHLIPLENVTYLRMASTDRDSLFDIESVLKFALLKHGVASDSDFSSHFSE